MSEQDKIRYTLSNYGIYREDTAHPEEFQHKYIDYIYIEGETEPYSIIYDDHIEIYGDMDDIIDFMFNDEKIIKIINKGEKYNDEL